MKCPLSAPAKPSKPRIPRLVGVSCSISQNICDQQSNIRPGSKVGCTPVAKTRQVAAKYMTTPRNKKCLSKRNCYEMMFHLSMCSYFVHVFHLKYDQNHCQKKLVSMTQKQDDESDNLIAPDPSVSEPRDDRSKASSSGSGSA